MVVIRAFFRLPYILLPMLVYIALMMTGTFPRFSEEMCNTDNGFSEISEACADRKAGKIGSIAEAFIERQIVAIRIYSGDNFNLTVGSIFQLATTLAIFMEGVRLQVLGVSFGRYFVSFLTACLATFLLIFVQGFFTKVFFGMTMAAYANLFSPLLNTYWQSRAAMNAEALREAGPKRRR